MFSAKKSSRAFATFLQAANNKSVLRPTVRSFHANQFQCAIKNLVMPSYSPTMESGTIKTWRKKEGEKVEVGDIIADVVTDKSTIEWEAQEPGFLAKILVPSGSENVSVGQVCSLVGNNKVLIFFVFNFILKDYWHYC